MFNIGGAELLVILLVALLVLGPDKLPEASKKIGSIMAELRQMSNGFKTEMKQAMDVSTEASARSKGSELTAAPTDPSSSPAAPADSNGSGGSGGVNGTSGASPTSPETSTGETSSASE